MSGALGTNRGLPRWGALKRQISRLCEAIEERVRALLDRPIDGSAYTPTALSPVTSVTMVGHSDGCSVTTA
jgi:hypothetical protein